MIVSVFKIYAKDESPDVPNIRIPRRISCLQQEICEVMITKLIQKNGENFPCLFLLTNPTSNLSVHSFGSILSFYDRQLRENTVSKSPTLTL